MNDCLNITAAVPKDDKRCPKEKVYGKRRVKQAWPFMMPGFRHRNRLTKMHDKGERCFYLNSGNDHSSDTHKVITPAGIATYSAHCTFGYRRQAFQGGVPTWGGGDVTSSRPWPSTASSPRAVPDPSAAATSSRGGGFPASTPATSAAARGGGHSSHVFIGSGGGGGGILDIFARGGCSSRVFIGTGTGGVGSYGWGGHSSHVFIGSDGYVGCCGDIFPRRGYFRRGSSGGDDRWHTCKRERSRTAGGSGCVAYAPASDPSVGAREATGELLASEQEQEQLAGGTHVSGSGVGPPAVVGASPTPPTSYSPIGAGAATGERLATEQEQGQLVASGRRREVLAEYSRMAGGTSPVSPGALPVASPAPSGPPPT